MTKEINIDIGGGERAEYFSGLARVNGDGLFIVLDPKHSGVHTSAFIPIYN